MQPHDYLVASERQHCRGRLRLERNDAPDVVELRAQVVEHLLSGFGGASGTMDDEVEVALLDAVAALHECMHIVRLDSQGRVIEAAPP